jgi:hypothetical protein
LKLALSDEVRASLEAVRLAQVAARLRARRQTMEARLWCATLVGAVVLVTLAFGPRAARWWHARSQPARSAQPSATGSRAVEPVIADARGTSTQGPEPSDRSASETSPVAARSPTEPSPVADRSASETWPVAAPVKPREAVLPDEGCEMRLLRTAPWRLSPAACARRFEADPSNAALALAVAQAEHAHARLAEAGRWARRALALDPNAAEAYVLVARADVEAGRPEGAREAYRHYLALAPRGWHHAEARAAVRGARTTAPVDSARDR